MREVQDIRTKLTGITEEDIQKAIKGGFVYRIRQFFASIWIKKNR